MLSRTNLADASCHSSLNPRFFILLQTLCRSQKVNSFGIKQIQTLLPKHPGWGVPRKNRPAESATYKLFSRVLFIISLTPRPVRLLLPTVHHPLPTSTRQSFTPIFEGHLFTPIFEGPLITSAVICATWRLYPLWPQPIAHTSRHHGGVLPFRPELRATAPPVARQFACFYCQLATVDFFIPTVQAAGNTGCPSRGLGGAARAAANRRCVLRSRFRRC